MKNRPLTKTIFPDCPEKISAMIATWPDWKVGTPVNRRGNTVFDINGHHITIYKKLSAGWTVLCCGCPDGRHDRMRHLRFSGTLNKIIDEVSLMIINDHKKRTPRKIGEHSHEKLKKNLTAFSR